MRDGTTTPEGNMTTMTIEEITENFNELLRRREGLDGPAGPQEYVEILTKATGGRWSAEYSRESDRQHGFGEIFRLFMEMGDPPMMRVQAKLTIETQEGPIGRHGSADGREHDEQTVQEIERRALANAISTLRRTG